jgi:hypothetical protein
MAKALTIALLFGFAILATGCSSRTSRLHDLTHDARRREIALKRYPGLGEARTGLVYRIKQQLLLVRVSAPERYAATIGWSDSPRSKEKYDANLAKWPSIIGYLDEGTRIRGVRLEEYEAAPLSSEVGWAGIVYEVIDGANSGKLLSSEPRLFVGSQADPKFLEPVKDMGP